MRPLKTKVSIAIYEDVIEKVRQLAENDDRSVSQFINLVLKGYIKGKEGKAERD
jgi:hypothetical protein